MQFYKQYFEELSGFLADVDHDELSKASDIVAQISGHNKVIIAGNGGSAAMASHVTVDLLKAAKIRALNFNEADLITCYANDYGYENWVDEALLSYADEGDVVILISSSGQSKNIINAAKRCNEMGLPLITFSGFKSDNPLRSLGNINFWINSVQYNYVEMTHHVWLLAIIDHIISKKNL